MRIQDEKNNNKFDRPVLQSGRLGGRGQKLWLQWEKNGFFFFIETEYFIRLTANHLIAIKKWCHSSSKCRGNGIYETSDSMYSFQPIWLRIYITKRTSLEGEDQDEYLSRGPTLALNLFFFWKSRNYFSCLFIFESVLLYSSSCFNFVFYFCFLNEKQLINFFNWLG